MRGESPHGATGMKGIPQVEFIEMTGIPHVEFIEMRGNPHAELQIAGNLEMELQRLKGIWKWNCKD